ncbi:MAG: permease prefix domain 2-containing transporter, partial [Cyclobacteriaceae bacterium]
MAKDSYESILKLLKLFCPPPLYEGIEGDLIEQFEDDSNTRGVRIAKRRLLWNVIRFFRPEIVFRNKLKKLKIYSPMWRNYLKVGWRNILKNRFYSVINSLGLALGIGFAYLTFLYVSGEIRYDKFHTKADQIYRMIEKSVVSATRETSGTSAVTPIPLGAKMQADYPEIEATARFGSFGSIVKKGDETFSQTVVVADREFFTVFDFETISGS